MASDTIKKPDYEFWDTQTIINLEQWAFLLCDIEPNTETGEHTGKFEHTKIRLWNDAKDRCFPYSTNDKRLIRLLPQSNNVNDICYASCSGEIYILREDLKKWLEHQKWKPKAIYKEERQKEKPIKYQFEGYETPLLRVMHEAIKKFCNANSIDNYPKKKSKEVEDFINAKFKEENLSESTNLASAMETIISPRPYAHNRQKKNR